MYRRVPDARARRLATLAAAEIGLEPDALPARAATTRKRRAILCYRSQLRALQTPGRPGWHDALQPERYWRLCM